MLIEVTPSKTNASIWSEDDQTHRKLFSDLSSTWKKGLFFNKRNGTLTVSGVGVAKVKVLDQTTTWSNIELDDSIRKEMLVEILSTESGCELKWRFDVRVRGRILTNEAGKIKYSCNSGALQVK